MLEPREREGCRLSTAPSRTGAAAGRSTAAGRLRTALLPAAPPPTEGRVRVAESVARSVPRATPLVPLLRPRPASRVDSPPADERTNRCRVELESSGSLRKKSVTSDRDPSPSLPVPPPAPRRAIARTAASGSSSCLRVNRAGVFDRVAVNPSRARRSRIESVATAARSTRCEMIRLGLTKVHPARSPWLRRTRPQKPNRTSIRGRYSQE